MESNKTESGLVFTVNSNTVALSSTVLAIIVLIWNVFFGYAKLISRMDVMQNDINDLKAGFIRLETRMDKMEVEFRKMDIRLTTVEQRKP